MNDIPAIFAVPELGRTGQVSACCRFSKHFGVFASLQIWVGFLPVAGIGLLLDDVVNIASLLVSAGISPMFRVIPDCAEPVSSVQYVSLGVALLCTQMVASNLL